MPIKRERERATKKDSWNKKLLIINIILLFVFTFVLSFINVPQFSGQIPNTITGNAVESGPECRGPNCKVVDKTAKGQYGIIGDLFATWGEGNLDVNIAKYLFWIIIMLFIFSSLNFAKIPENGFLQFLLAIIISFLATAYITPEEVFTVLTTYTALGLTLSVIVPFIILIFFSAMLLSNEKISQMTVAKVMMEVMLWLFFVAFLLYKLIVGYSGHELSTGMRIVMFGVLILSGGILVINKHFRKWVRELGTELKRAKYEVEKESRMEAKDMQSTEEKGNF